MNKVKLIYIVAVPGTVRGFLAERMHEFADMYEVSAVCSPGAEHEELRTQGLKTHEILINRRISLWQDVKSVWCLWRFLHREKPMIVHSMTPKAGLLGMMAAFLAGVPVRMHTFTGLIFPWKCGMMQRILRWTDALTCAFATVVNPEGEGVRQQLEAYRVTNKPLYIIANGNINGVNLARFTPGKGRAEKRHELSIAQDDVVFVCVGRMVADKGISELVEAFCKLYEQHPQARLILVGREEPTLDPLPEVTRQMMRQHPGIIYAGAQRNVEAWLAAGDIYVLPSHREGFCNSLLEAAAMGLPCITYDICGCHDSVDAQTGILIPPYDHQALYEAMAHLVEDRARREALGEAARKRVEERFDRRYVWGELRAFYKRVVAEKLGKHSSIVLVDGHGLM